MPDLYRAADDVVAAPLARELVLLHTGHKRYYRLNPTGAAVWEAVVAGATREGVVDALQLRYDVEPGAADAATAALLEELVARGLLTRTPGPAA